MDTQPLDDLPRTVLHVLASHVGADQAITRSGLLHLVNAELGTQYGNDRPIRNAVEWLRSNHPHGAFICANYPSEGEPGYFLGRDENEVREFMLPDWKRLRTLEARLNAQERLLSQSAEGVFTTQDRMAI